MPTPDPTRDPRTASAGDPAATRDLSHPTTGDADPAGTYLQTPVQAAASAAVSGAPDTIPGYEILAKIGEGGMGVVYRARQLGLNREVAVKQILRADAARAAVARFWAEAEVMAAVRHPHVVQVIELGEHAGRPFLAMEYLGGGTLGDRIAAAAPLPPTEAARLVGKVAAGVAAAHELDIVHRDLKPGNVLLDAAGEPKVTDFGLAKRKAHDLTQTQALMGTPAYMAPEQAAGRAKFVGPPADVWALGVILYECLTGKRPFEGESVGALLSQIQSAEPAALRARVRSVPRDLDTIVAKCLAKEPEHRYPTAAGVADDLGRFVRGEPIAARPVGRAERLARWVRRKPTAAAAWAGTGLAALLTVVVFVVVGFWREADTARGRVEDLLGTETRLRGELQTTNGKLETALRGEQAALKVAEREREKLAAVEYGRTVQVAHQEWRENNVSAALALLDGTQADSRGWEWRYVHRLCNGQLLALRGHTGGVRSAGWGPDGAKVVTANRDGPVRVWDARTGAELLTLRGHTGTVFSASFSPDGGRIVTGGEDNTARVWDAWTGVEVLTLKHTGSVTSASFDADGARIVTASSTGGTARVWDARTGAELLALKHAGEASFSPDGTRVLTFWADTAPRVLDARTGAELLVLEHAGGVDVASFSPNGRRVATAGPGGTVRVWDARTGAELLALRGHNSPVRSAGWSPDGGRIVICVDDTARVWDTKTGAEVLILRGDVGIWLAAWSPDGTRIATAGGKTVRIWDATPTDPQFLPKPVAPPPRPR